VNLLYMSLDFSLLVTWHIGLYEYVMSSCALGNTRLREMAAIRSFEGGPLDTTILDR
jgi:hypothetical protein